MIKKSSLVVVGSGIKFMSHMTQEAIVYIKQSEKVLYLVNEPAIKEWIKQINPNAESLDALYTKHSFRVQCYREITHYILEILRKNNHVCVVLYGHPVVFAQPALDAVIQAKNEGYDAKILPGISSEDCLFTDLLIDPGSCGCQSFDATDFLLYSRKFDTSSHLILWQIGIIGKLTNLKIESNNYLDVLFHYLKNYYHISHEIIIYEAAQYPYFQPRIDKMPLCNLIHAKCNSISTLYIPPKSKANYNKKMLELLNIDIESHQTPKLNA